MDKQARRKQIIDAARSLFVASDGVLPAAAEIAAAAGLAKGTVYLYFCTKDEIFLSLLIEEWQCLLERVAVAFKRAKGSRTDKIITFIEAYVDNLESNQGLLRLDSLGHGILAFNIPPATIDEARAAFGNLLASLGMVIEDALQLPPGTGFNLIKRSYALTGGLWQCHSFGRLPHKKIRPDLSGGDLPFRDELFEALVEYWNGAIAAAELGPIPSTGNLWRRT